MKNKNIINSSLYSQHKRKGGVKMPIEGKVVIITGTLFFYRIAIINNSPFSKFKVTIN